jgi:uncharacterized protein YodC (DUF2158 family)
MFETNDTVILKSGGPKMIVVCCDDIAGVPHVWCLWREKGEEKFLTFPESLLTSVGSDAPLAA